MNTAISPPPASARPWRRYGLPVALAGLGAVLLGFHLVSPRKAAPGTALRSELESRGGLLHRKGAATPFSGVMIEQYPGGAMLSRSEIVGGRLHGLSEGWHTNGQIQVREAFVRGAAQGTRTKWYANGATQSVATIVAGRLQGSFRRWYQDGTLAEELQLKDGQPDGLALAYHPGGSIKSRVVARAGKVVEQRFWKEGDHPSVSHAPAVAATGAVGQRH